MSGFDTRAYGALLNHRKRNRPEPAACAHAALGAATQAPNRVSLRDHARRYSTTHNPYQLTGSALPSS
jgi:hypothetical protein